MKSSLSKMQDYYLPQPLIYKLSCIYLIFGFFYSLTILVLSIIVNQKLPNVPIPYEDLFNNWQLDPIYSISLPTDNGCTVDQEQFFNLRDGDQQYNKWWHQTNSFSLCLNRLIGYNFEQKYSLYPKCKAEEEICGGVYVENKYCAPIGQCPINSILFVNEAQLTEVDLNKYTKQIKIADGFYVLTSSLVESLPISQLSIFGQQACIPSQFSNYNTIFSQAFCQADTRNKLLNQIDEIQYAKANSITSTTANKVGVYSRSFDQFSQECRLRNMVGWGFRTITDAYSLQIVQPMLVVLSGINFGLIGFLYSLYYFLQVQYQANYDPKVGTVLMVLKTVTQWMHSIIVLLAFGMALDIKLFLELSTQLKCMDNVANQILKDTLTTYDPIWKLDIVIFIIFLVYVVFECSSCSICLDKALKSRKPKYEQVISSSLNQSVVSQQQQYIVQYFKQQPQLLQQQPQQPQQQQFFVNIEDNIVQQQNSPNVQYSSFQPPQQKPAQRIDYQNRLSEVPEIDDETIGKHNQIN